MLQKGAHGWQRGPTDEHGESHPWVRAAIRGHSPVRIEEGQPSDPNVCRREVDGRRYTLIGRSFGGSSRIEETAWKGQGF